MANMFDENGNYNKTEWKPGDRITAVKLNKIEESLEAINNNDIERHKEADERLDALEEQNEAVEERFDELEDLVADNKSEVDTAIYEVHSKMDRLETKLDDGIDTVEAIAHTVDDKIADADASMKAQVAEAEDIVDQGKADISAIIDEVEKISDLESINEQLARIENKTKESINVTFFGVKGDGITDNTDILQELLDKYESLYFPPGVYIASNLLLNSFNHIYGEGRKSHLKQKANTNGHFITCKEPESHSIKITSLYIDGNASNQSTDNDGVHIVNSLAEIGYEQIIDHYLVIDNIYVEKCSGTGVSIEYTRECKINNLVVRQCKKDGIYFNGSDSSFSNCTVSTSDVAYHFHTGASRLTNCKAFVNNVGFFFDGQYCTNVVMNSCDTQSNRLGYKLVNCKNINMSNILSDSDGSISMIIDNAKSCYIQGVIDDKYDEINRQGIHIKNNTSNCKIDIIANSYKLNKFTEKVVFDKCISSNEVIVNNNNLLKNIFKYDPLASKINNRYDTLNNASSSSISFDTNFINDKMVINILNNDDITNYASINFETDYIELPSNYKLGASATLMVENGENITPSVVFVCADSKNVLGKIAAYITSPESNSICINSISNESSLFEGTTRVKVSFSFDTKQIVSANSLSGYILSISNPKITII